MSVEIILGVVMFTAIVLALVAVIYISISMAMQKKASMLRLAASCWAPWQTRESSCLLPVAAAVPVRSASVR